MMNVANPDRAFGFAALPNHGVGLARLEFIVNRMIGVHPRALLDFDRLDRDAAPRDRRADGGLSRSRDLLRHEARRRHRADRRRVRAGARHRAAVGFQVERVREPARRPSVRAARGEPDARVPRRRALRRPCVPAVLRARVPSAALRARGDGARQRGGHGAVRAHGRRSRAESRSCWPRTGSSAASMVCASS